MNTMLKGQIWMYHADPTVGQEIGKTRPCVIVSNDEIGVLQLKVIVPITGWNDAFVKVPWMLRVLSSRCRITPIIPELDRKRLTKPDLGS